MGLLGKILGLEKKGKISVTVEKPSYIAGELVIGAISIEVYEPIECNAVVLKATGKEKVSWTVERVKIDGESDEKEFERQKEFFKEKIVICSIANTYMPGSYKYPFEYQLPPDLPGVFELEDYSSGHIDDLTCHISYKLKATLEVNGFFSKDLKDTCHLVVHEKLMQSVQPSHDATSQQVNFLCCFSKGTCDLDVTMDKNVYAAGETAQIFCKIQNRSSVDITNMRCKLMQVIQFKSDGGKEVFEREMCTQAFSGVPAGSTMEQPQPLALVPKKESLKISPSTAGRFIMCSYHVDIECDIPWCPDVHLTLPLTIIAPIVLMAPMVPVPMPVPM